MGKRVVMTVDRSMASDYRGIAYFGFSACLPRRVLPEWLYYRLVAPAAPAGPDGSIGLADCGSRKVEAALRRERTADGSFVFAHPDRLDEAIGPETRVFLFGSHDPLGVAPLTSMLAHLMGGEGGSYNAASVRRMLGHPGLRRHRPVIIAGGAGAWELAVDAEARARLGVDCVVVGEAEIVVPGLVRRALEGGALPEVVHGASVPVEDIPGLEGPTVNGVQEITRGCGRGCLFCVPNLQSLRSIPVDRVCADAEVNAPANEGRVTFHSEDLFRYDALPEFQVNHDAICNLFESVSRVNGVRSIGASHGTLSSVVSSPETVREIARIRRLGLPGGPKAIGLQMGVETGSRRLAREHLASKMRPYHPDDWPEVVREGARILHENRFFSCFTLIFGLPGETADDVRDTLRLVRDLDRYPSTIVPLFFVPMGIGHRDRGRRPFSYDRMTPAHFDLLQATWDHNYRHLGAVWEQYGRDDRQTLKRIVHVLARLGTGHLRRRLRRFSARHGTSPDPFRELERATPAEPRMWTRPQGADGDAEKAS